MLALASGSAIPIHADPVRVALSTGGFMIVVTTPTGQIGHHVVRDLLAAGESVRVIVRDPSRLPHEVRTRVEVMQGNHNDRGITMTAFDGADAVFYVVPPDAATDDVSAHYRAFAEAAAPAISSHGVRRVVAVSTLGRGYTKEAGHLSAALEAESVLEGTGVDYRSLGMPFFMDNLLNQMTSLKEHGMIFMPNSADQELLTVATQDIARVAVRLLTDRTWTGQEAVPVVSPDHLTPTQMAQVLSEVLGTSIRYQQISTEDYAATLSQYGMSRAWVQGLADMATAQNDGIYSYQQREPQSVTPTTFRAWCESVLRPAFENPTPQW